MQEYYREFNLTDGNIKIQMSLNRINRWGDDFRLIIKIVLLNTNDSIQDIYEYYLTRKEVVDLISFFEKNLNAWNPSLDIFSSLLYSNKDNNLIFYTRSIDFSPIFSDETKYILLTTDPIEIIISVRKNKSYFFSFEMKFFYNDIKKLISDFSEL